MGTGAAIDATGFRFEFGGRIGMSGRTGMSSRTGNRLVKMMGSNRIGNGRGASDDDLVVVKEECKLEVKSGRGMPRSKRYSGSNNCPNVCIFCTKLNTLR